jgi:membrane-associated phospholipid phosphatase
MEAVGMSDLIGWLIVAALAALVITYAVAYGRPVRRKK